MAFLFSKNGHEFYTRGEVFVCNIPCLVVRGAAGARRRRALGIGARVWVDGPFHLRRVNPSGYVWLFTSADVINCATGEVLL